MADFDQILAEKSIHILVAIPISLNAPPMIDVSVYQLDFTYPRKFHKVQRIHSGRFKCHVRDATETNI